MNYTSKKGFTYEIVATVRRHSDNSIFGYILEDRGERGWYLWGTPQGDVSFRGDPSIRERAKSDINDFDEFYYIAYNREEGKELSQTDLFKQVCDNMYETYLAKNNDYGNSVQNTYDKYGDVSFLTRLSDKLNRLDTLCTGTERKVEDEKIEDTILDLANYAVLFYVTRMSNKNK